MLVNGDCTVIESSSGKNIIIDTGEKENTVVEYLLDRQIKKVDYLIISHFDSDHCKNSVEIIEKLKVKNLVITKQTKESNEFKETISKASEKKVNIIVVQKGDTIKIDKDTYFEILWPNNEKIIKENPLNNNSMVAKMYYKTITVLFTGDIEEKAEKQILNEKIDIKSTILKIAHHGSKTSSTEEFLKYVNCKIALIGVGKDNKFGHPNEEIIKRLENNGNIIYRTDELGEITITINKNGKINVENV